MGQRLADAASDLRGTPFFRNGRSRTGVDEIGFILVAGEMAGCKFPDLVRFARNADHPEPRLIAWLGMFADRVELDDREAGDILIVRHNQKQMGDCAIPAVAVNIGNYPNPARTISSVAMVWPECQAAYYFPTAFRDIARFRVPDSARRGAALNGALVDIAAAGFGGAAA